MNVIQAEQQLCSELSEAIAVDYIYTCRAREVKTNQIQPMTSVLLPQVHCMQAVVWIVNHACSSCTVFLKALHKNLRMQKSQKRVKKNEKAGSCRLYNINLFSWLGCGRYSGGGRSRGGIETGEEGWEMWEGIGYVTTGEQYTLRSLVF